MKRIGVAASKMAKGNQLIYNLYVILIATLFSLFIFFVAGATLLLVLTLLYYLGHELNFFNTPHDWKQLFFVCMGVFTLVIIVFDLIAILKNIKFLKQDTNDGF